MRDLVLFMLLCIAVSLLVRGVTVNGVFYGVRDGGDDDGPVHVEWGTKP